MEKPSIILALADAMILLIELSIIKILIFFANVTQFPDLSPFPRVRTIIVDT